MSDSSIWYLENIDVTGLFCPKKLGAGHMHEERRYQKGEYIYFQDDLADRIYFLFEGQVKIGTTGDTATRVILQHGRADIVLPARRVMFLGSVASA